MTGYIEIHWTCGSIDEGRRVCRFLVQERMVACAQLIPWVESIYMWNNQLETSQESKVVLKSHLSLYDKIKDVITQHTSYEVPEITYCAIDGGNESYMQWLSESVYTG